MERYMDIQIGDYQLRAFESGELWRYINKRSKHYKQTGWNKMPETFTKDGYVRNKFMIDGQHVPIYRHRVIYYAFNRDWDINNPKNMIDHINRQKGDNRIENLRSVTCSQNLCNTSAQRNSKTGHKNISPYNFKNYWSWRLRIKLHGKEVVTKYYRVDNGKYPDPLPPVPQYIIDKRNELLMKYHGEYSTLNYDQKLDNIDIN